MKLHFKLFFLFLIFLPTQLTLFFWPDYAYVSGIRVDYLAPVIYFTDFLLALTFLVFLREEKVLFKQIFTNKWIVFLLCLACLNVLFSTIYEVSVFKWLKIFEAAAVYVYTSALSKKLLRKMAPALMLGVLFTAFLAFGQILSSKSLGGVFYYFGERRLSIYSPGIALMSIGNSDYLRPYATFPHPNSLAGYTLAVVGIVLVVSKAKWQKVLTATTGLSVVVVAYSQNAWLSLCGALFVAIGISKNKLAIRFIIIGLFVFALLASVFSGTVLEDFQLSREVKQRIELLYLGGKALGDNWLLGIGLGTFPAQVPALSRGVPFINSSQWWLQPIHSIPVLAFVEGGIVGIGALFIFLMKLVDRAVQSRSRLFLFYLILLTSLFDHYWLTLHQNLLIGAIAFGTIQNQWEN